MTNGFDVTACRFHTKEKNILALTGYFRENHWENEQLSFQMRGLELPCKEQEVRLHPVQFRKVDGQLITRQMLYWITLPDDWRRAGCLKVFQIKDGRKVCRKKLSGRKLGKLERYLAASVDIVRTGRESFHIEGWYMNCENASLCVKDGKENVLDMEVSETRRLDVLREYPENVKEEIAGFSITCRGTVPQMVTVCVKDGNRENQIKVGLKRKLFKQRIHDARVMEHKLREYYKQFGFEATCIRAADKLMGREYSGYSEWLRRNRPSKAVLRRQRKEEFVFMPKISILVPLYKTPEDYLKKMIDSVRNQSYENWELCLSDGSGADSCIRESIKKYLKEDKRIRFAYRGQALQIAENTNEAFAMSTGDYLTFLDHDDLLSADALYECVKTLNEHPDIELIYSDEDKVTEDGKEYYLPHFKPDFNMDLLRSTNYFCHLVMVKRGLYERTGNLNPDFNGAQDYDFVIRCVEKTTADKIYHIPKVLYHWRACEGSTSEAAGNKAYIIEAGARAVQAHYARMKIDAEVCPLAYGGMYRSKYHLHTHPKVSVIIPNKDHVEDLQKCMDSLEKRNSYDNMEYLIVENNSEREETFAYYEKLEKACPKARVLYWQGEGFNYPDINNYGVQCATGEYLLLLNNDTEIIREDCIEELLGYCMREEVGVVGARLFYDDGTLQHGGVIVGLGGVAGHAFLGLPSGEPGYFARALLAQDMSAVTAACMMVKKSVYKEVGGFDPAFAVAFNDVDFCLKVRQAGYLVVYNPYAELYHYESKSRGYDDTAEKIGRFQSEIQLFQSRWKDFLKQGDPYYNPNLTLDRNDFSVNLSTRQKQF